MASGIRPGHHLLLHLKNPRIRYPVEDLSARRRTGDKIVQPDSTSEARPGQSRMPVQPTTRYVWK
jgi:hypothetical protein